MKKQSIIASILFYGIALLFISSAWSKLAGGPMVVAMFSSLNIEAYRIALGVIEIIIAAALCWKPLRTVGTLIATGYLGGAIMATLVLGMAPFMPGAVLVSLWIAYKLDMWVSWFHCGCGTCKTCTKTPSTCKCSRSCACERNACTCN